MKDCYKNLEKLNLTRESIQSLKQFKFRVFTTFSKNLSNLKNLFTYSEFPNYYETFPLSDERIGFYIFYPKDKNEEFNGRIRLIHSEEVFIVKKYLTTEGTNFIRIDKEISFIEKLEEKAQYFRPIERKKGQTDEVLNGALGKLEQTVSFKKLSELKKEIWQKFSEIKIDKNRKVLRVGVVGEIYTVVDGGVNFSLDKKLGEMGVKVHRKLNLSQHLKDGLLPWDEWLLQRKVNSYLKPTVGGHGRQAIEEILEYAKEGFDGVIQLLPFGCMPEITVRPILQKISQEKKLPFLSVSLDEQTAETGIQTRLEAFVDLMRSKQQLIPH